MSTKYYYCPEDSYGQRTGEVRTIYLTENEVEYKHGLLYMKDRPIHLYTDYAMAQRAARS